MKTIQATVTKIERGQKVGVLARVRRGYREEGVSGTADRLATLRVGDKISVMRVPNCPYLCIAGE